MPQEPKPKHETVREKLELEEMDQEQLDPALFEPTSVGRLGGEAGSYEEDLRGY